MKILNRFLLSALAASAVLPASALNYSANDLLLVFRKDGQKDVVFDIGPASSFTSSGPVAFDLDIVKSNFNNSLSDVRFGIVGATANTDPQLRVWVSDASVYSAAASMTFSRLSVLRGKIENVGINATIYTATNASPYVSTTSSPGSYDYLVSDGTQSSVSTMHGDAPLPVGGLAPVPVDAAYPTTIALYQLQVSSTTPKPAGTLVGGFTLDVNGGLAFTAGKLPALLPAVATATTADPIGQTAAVSFQTSLGQNYQLLYATDLAGPWTVVPGAGVANGDGTEQTLDDNGAFDDQRFYRIQTTY